METVGESPSPNIAKLRGFFCYTIIDAYISKQSHVVYKLQTNGYETCGKKTNDSSYKHLKGSDKDQI